MFVIEYSFEECFFFDIGIIFIYVLNYVFENIKRFFLDVVDNVIYGIIVDCFYFYVEGSVDFGFGN